MVSSIVFIAYTSSPEMVGQTIEASLTKFAGWEGRDRITSWRENDVSGRFIVDPIPEHIVSSQCLVADISTLNFDVAYEIGYAIGRARRVMLIKNKAIAADEKELKRVGIFDTLWYPSYENAEELYRILVSLREFTPQRFTTALNTGAPVYILQLPFNIDAQTRIIARVKNARLRFRSFDPAEQSRLAAPETIENIAASFGVIVPLAPTTMQDARVHNLRAAFTAGLSHGMEKVTAVIQAGDDPVPLDYRDVVDSYRHPQQIDEIIERFALEVTDSLPARGKAEPPAQGFFASLAMGSSTVENEFVNLGEYYVQTDQFRRALRGEVRIVVGRKGSDKTAVFAQVRDHIRADRDQIVLDLKPEGYQLRKFKEYVLDLLEVGTREHTITGFWEYLLLLEAAYKILETDHLSRMRDQKRYEPYQKRARIYRGDHYSQEGDFSERSLRHTERTASSFEANYPGAQRLRLTGQQVTELLYVHDIRELREQTERYLMFKAGLWILFDNLDEGLVCPRPYARGFTDHSLPVGRYAYDRQSLRPKGATCNTIVFLRNDVYTLLVEATPDRGKEICVSLESDSNWHSNASTLISL
jgi:hypothetical protein